MKQTFSIFFLSKNNKLNYTIFTIFHFCQKSSNWISTKFHDFIFVKKSSNWKFPDLFFKKSSHWKFHDLFFQKIVQLKKKLSRFFSQISSNRTFFFIEFQECDVANHFDEMAGVENMDFLKNYPTQAFQLDWIKTYLAAYGSPNQPDETQIWNFYVNVNKFSLCYHMMWGLWGLVQASISKIDFDFVAFALSRLNEYFRVRDQRIDMMWFHKIFLAFNIFCLFLLIFEFVTLSESGFASKIRISFKFWIPFIFRICFKSG